MIDVLFTISGAVLLTLIVCLIMIEIQNIKNGNTENDEY
jgi:hypothetical protein